MALLASEAMGAEGTGYYDGAYARSSEELYAAIRREAFGEDIGQFSWLTAEEYATFADWLEIDCRIARAGGRVRYGRAGPLSRRPHRLSDNRRRPPRGGASRKRQRARRSSGSPTGPASFRRTRAPRLPFDDAKFDALVCIDAWNHLDDREAVLADWHRVLRPRSPPRLHRSDRRHGDAAARRDGGAQRLDGRVRVHAARCRRAACRGRRLRRRQGRGRDGRTCGKCRGAGARHGSSTVPSSTRSKGTTRTRRFQRFLEVVELLARERRLSRIAIVARRP